MDGISGALTAVTLVAAIGAVDFAVATLRVCHTFAGVAAFAITMNIGLSVYDDDDDRDDVVCVCRDVVLLECRSRDMEEQKNDNEMIGMGCDRGTGIKLSIEDRSPDYCLNLSYGLINDLLLILDFERANYLLFYQCIKRNLIY